MQVLIAHGALGSFDELILLAVALAFVAMMAFAWWRSRHAAVPGDADDIDTPADGQPDAAPPAEEGHRFPLE